MSDEPQRKSRKMTWTASVAAALLLYMAPWPLVELKYCRSGHWSPGMARLRIDGPMWLVWLYTPLNVLRDSNEGKNPFGLYWDYWSQWKERQRQRAIEREFEEDERKWKSRK